MKTGIYKIENLINHKVYIGQSINIEERWKDHIFYGEHKYTILQAAFKKYGINNFNFSIIEECPKEKLNEREIYWISFYNSYKDGYNMTRGGNGGHTADYEQIVENYKKTQNLAETSRQLNVHLVSVRNALNYYNIEYNKDRGKAQPLIMINPYTLQEEQQFNSITEAAKFLNISDSTIRKYLKGNLKTAGGYYWKLLGEEKQFKKLTKGTIQTTKKIQIGQYDQNYNLINIYQSLSQANIAMGKSRSLQKIKEACEKNILMYGYYWKYI